MTADKIPHTSKNTDSFSSQGIQKYLSAACAGLDIAVIPAAASTNALVRERANSGAPEGYTVIANEQNAGRGRLGRSFFSPPDTGVYLSLLLRPQNDCTAQALHITTIAAVAMCEAIEAVSETCAQIKWVNDVFVREKKVCGILTEAAFNQANGLLEYAVLGLGVNVYKPEGGFPEELAQIAGAVFSSVQNDGRNRLTATFLNRFFAYYNTPNQAAYIEEYRRRCFVIGRRVSVVSMDQSRPATVLGVDEECRLLVRYDGGNEARLSSGEISIRF